MTDFSKLDSIAEAFMKASGFYQGGQAGSIGKTVMDNMDDEEQSEYGWDLPRRHRNWAEFFSKAAIRQGRLSDITSLVPVDQVDAKVISDLAVYGTPSFALVVSAALNNRR